MRLTAKFLLAFILTSLVVLGVGGYLQILRETAHFEEDMRRDVSAFAVSLGHSVAEILRSGDTAAAARLVAKASASAEHLVVRWVRLDNEPDFLELAPLPPEVLGNLRPEVPTVRTTQGSNARLYAYALIPSPSLRGGITAIEVSESLQLRDEFVQGSLHRNVVTLLLAFGMMSFLALALGILLVGRPLEKVVLGVRAIGAGDLHARVQIRQADEIGELADEINEMSLKLAQNRAALETESQARLAAVEQLRHVERLATVGRLASGIAHELGTPLGVVSGRAQMLMNSGSDVSENALIIFEQTQAMTQIIRQLLDFARRRPGAKGRVDLFEFAESSTLILQPIAERSGVGLKVENELTTHVQLSIDMGQTRQALTNIVINAIQASARGGTVRVIVGARPGAATLRVVDTGDGMSPQVLDHIFEPFFTTKDVGQGTGLGLPVAYGLIQDQGGTIEVTTELGVGTTFLITLPWPMESEPTD